MATINNTQANAIFPVHPELSGAAYDLQLLSDSIIGPRAMKGFMTKTVLPIGKSTQTFMSLVQGNQGQQLGARFGYLPILKVMSQETYAELNALAPYTAWIQETLADYVGRVFSRPPSINIPDALQRKLEENGIDLAQVAKKVFMMVCGFGRVAVEAIPMEGRVVVTIRPSYEARNWGKQDSFGRVPWCILEHYDYEADEDYEQTRADFANVWKKNGSGVELGIYKGTKDNAPQVLNWSDLDQIPVVSINMDGLGWSPVQIPLSDIAYLNLSHYQLAAALKLKLYRGVVSIWYKASDDEGGEDSDGEITAGPSGLVRVSASGSIGVAEETGAMVGQLREAINQVLEELSQLGAVSMQDAKKAAETAETARLRQAAIVTRIRGVLSACTTGMTEVVVMLSKLLGTPIEPSPELFAYNQELGDLPVTKDEVDMMMMLFDEAIIDKETFIRTLFERRALPSALDLDAALERARAEEEDEEPPADDSLEGEE